MIVQKEVPTEDVFAFLETRKRPEVVRNLVSNFFWEFCNIIYII